MLNFRKRATTAPHYQGFTLIELLVVIAIIALLAAILFPVFARARENARKSSCLNNMKQLGLGILQYTQDYDETFFWGLPINGQGWPGIGWAGATNPYIKNFQVYRCPNDRGGGTSSTFNSTQISYAFSTTVAQKNLADINFSSKMVLLSEVSVGFNVNYTNPQENGDYRSPADYGDNLVWGTNTVMPSASGVTGQCCNVTLNRRPLRKPHWQIPRRRRDKYQCSQCGSPLRWRQLSARRWTRQMV